MDIWQKYLVILFLILNIFLLKKSYIECKIKNNAYGITKPLFILGMFVWGDVVIYSVFWIIVSIISLIFEDKILFLVFLACFWIIRSLGETIYWFLQQFSDNVSESNKPKNLLFNSVFHNDSVWFVYQIMWQCVTVFSAVFLIYLLKSF